MNDIEEALVLFEEYNHIKLENYVSDDYECTIDDELVLKDNYIGKDVFRKHVEEWLEFFEDEDKHIFLELLSHYRYFTKGRYRNIMTFLYRKVLEELLEGEENSSVMFITFPSKNGRCSGGDHIRSMLEAILLGKLSKDNIIADVDKVEEDAFDKIKYVVFIDDIIGSGTTLYGRVKSACEKFKLNERNDIKIFIATIYANKEKADKKKKELEKKAGIHISKIIEYETTGKCFADERVFDRKVQNKYQDIVKEYETIIESKKMQGDDEADSILGFEKGQLLVSFFYNTPNNTLSSFWRPSEVSQPLFIRNKYVRPSTASIRKNKKHYQKNAYLKRQIENGIESE